MVRNRVQDGRGRGVGASATGARPASRARQTASRGIRTPETAYRTLLDCAGDILAGSLTTLESNGVRNAITGAVVVAKHADMMADMAERCAGEEEEDGCPDDGLLDDDDEVASLRRRVAELEGRKRPQKG